MGKQTIADIGVTCWKCGEVIKFGDDDGCTYPTNPAKYAHAECPVDRTMSVTSNNSSTTRILKKCPQCGFPEHNATPCPVVTDKLYGYTPKKGMISVEPSLSLLIVDFGENCVLRVEKGEFSLERLAATFDITKKELKRVKNKNTHVLLASFAEVRSDIDAHFAEDASLPRLETNLPCSPDVYFLITDKDKPDEPEWLRDKMHTIYPHELEALNKLARQAGATEDLPVYEPKGRWIQLGENPTDIPFSIWRYER